MKKFQNKGAIKTSKHIQFTKIEKLSLKSLKS